MSVNEPLRFHPLLRRYIWGGRRLESLGKVLDSGEDFAESWEIVDRGADQSVVAAGAWQGRTLGELVAEHPRDVLGTHAHEARFPLLFKFLDAHKQLSIQVHPDDARAALIDPPDRGKTEAWVVLDAAPDSYLYAGLRHGIDQPLLEREMKRRTCELCLERIEPRAGDCFFLPAGVVHALGPGLLVAEIQQASDTTYRLFDWNRPGSDGRPRQLHVVEALAAIDYDYGPVAAQQPQSTAHGHVERLVSCDKFVLDRWRFSGPATAGGDDRFHILAVLSGALEIAGDPVERPLKRGQVALLPAALGATAVHAAADTVVLDAYLP